MERLIEKQLAGYDLIDMKGAWCALYCRGQSIYTCKDCAIYKAIQKLADYKDLEEQGLLLRLPCKVGTPVYNTTWWDDVTETITVKGTTYYRSIIKHKVSKSNFSLRDLDKFGKEVFLTKEEAEAKLKELEGSEDK